MLSEGKEIYDITIIGAGPAGLFAAFYAGMRQMKMKIIDALPHLGGQLTALYPEKFIYDMPGFPKVRASELVHLMTEQALQFNPVICLNETAQTLKKREQDGIFVLETNRDEHLSRTILLCVGIGAFHPRRLGKPDVERFEGRGVTYTVSNVDGYREKRVLIVGGGDSAVDWALTLEPIAKEIHLIHRRDQFRAHEHSVEQLLRSSVHVHLFYELETVLGNERPETAIVFHNKTGERISLPVDEIILSLGFTTNLGPVKTWGLEMEGNDVVVDRRMMTNIPGVFAAGDVATYPGKVKLIATGVAEAAIAVNQAKVFIDPTARLQPAFSTTTGLPTTR